MEDGKIVSAKVVDTNGSGHGALAGVLAGIGTDVLICGGIGENAIKALTDFEIKVVNGVIGDCDISIAKFLAKTLNFSLEANCKHEQELVERHKCHSHHE